MCRLKQHDVFRRRLISFAALLIAVLNDHVDGFAVHVPSRASDHKLASTNTDVGIGIDLGTTFSAIAFLQDDQPAILPTPDNGRTMPSVVTFVANSSNNNSTSVLPVVGVPACDCELQAGGAYRNVKRVLGTGGKLSSDVKAVVPFLKASATGKTYQKNSLLNQVHDASEHPTLLRNNLAHQMDPSNNDPYLRPEEISAHVIRTLKESAEDQLNQTVTRAVIGIPAYFHDGQREATIQAANIAGIPKVKLLREPEAAALAYGVGKEQIGAGDEDELVLVFDLGGGTFDVSMLVVGGGVTEIIATSGDSHLGGSVFDAKIAQYISKVIQKQGSAGVKKWSKDSRTAIVLAAERIRIYLSNNKRINLALPLAEKAWAEMIQVSSVILPLSSANGGGKDDIATNTNSTHVTLQLSRKDMERMCKDELQALLRPIREVAIMAEALLPGDSSPSIVDSALEFEKAVRHNDDLLFSGFYDEQAESLPSSPSASIAEDTLLPDEIFELQKADLRGTKKAQQRGRKRARTVAKQERKFRQEKRKLEENKNFGPGMENVKVREGISGRPINRVVLVGGATRMPAIGQLLTAITGVVPQRTVNPDEAVALGCAVHAGALDGKEGLGTVLNPMQAAILRAVARQQGLGDDDFDDEDFDSIEYF